MLIIKRQCQQEPPDLESGELADNHETFRISHTKIDLFLSLLGRILTKIFDF
jgi:hypothetical protein